MNVKIGTLNLCLGLRNKKDEIKRLLIEKKIDILCVQETEIDPEFPIDSLTISGYGYESEANEYKSRVGIYISNKISYTRKTEDEGTNSHVIIINLNDQVRTKIINIYRSFNPPGAHTQKSFFEMQLSIIKNASNPNTIILGDFNLDHAKKFDVTYSHKLYFRALNETIPEFHQIVTFATWSRTVNNIIKESILDHIYTKKPVNISNLTCNLIAFGDHNLITFEINSNTKIKPEIYKRNWLNYTKEKLCSKLNSIDWNIEYDDVQGYWNCFESKLVEAIDVIAPIELQKHRVERNHTIPSVIKNKINRRDRLLKKTIANNRPDRKDLLKSLNKEIKLFFHTQKKKQVRCGILPGNSKSLWDAVRIANDKNVTGLPETLYFEGVELQNNNKPTAFGDLFFNKVKNITEQTLTNPNVYNGHIKITEHLDFTLGEKEVGESIKSLKTKNCEGFDRIPQRVLTDGINELTPPLTILFQKILKQKKIPEQWSISKIIPIHKKGPKQNIENYRPIANLCSATKIFERLILTQLQKLESLNGIDLTGINQHGFKKNRSTATLGLEIQSLIARALDENNHVLMASIDLSSAFDVVNIELLLKRLRLLGMPVVLVELIEVWLSDRCFYVEVDGLTSKFYKSISGTIQGSILVPILYAIFVSPLFDLIELYNFADDNFSLSYNRNIEMAKNQLITKLQIATTWLTDSGLKVNDSKTELCKFHKNDTTQVEIVLNNVIIKSKNTMNVLGVEFDSKLNWNPHINKAILKSNKSLYAIKLIRKYFNSKEILNLLTSNYYSILYYNSEIWHLPSLSPETKQMLLSASANALKISQKKLILCNHS